MHVEPSLDHFNFHGCTALQLRNSEQSGDPRYATYGMVRTHSQLKCAVSARDVGHGTAALACTHVELRITGRAPAAGWTCDETRIHRAMGKGNARLMSSFGQT